MIKVKVVFALMLLLKTVILGKVSIRVAVSERM